MTTTVKVTLKDIARRAGCGVGTVSDIVNRNKLDEYSEKNIARIRTLAADMGYVTNRQASSLRTGKTKTIGITHGFMTNLQAGFSFPYSAQIYQGLGSVLDTNEFSMLFQNVRALSGGSDAGPVEMARSGGIDALVYIYFSSFRAQFEKEHAAALKGTALPVVVIHTTDKYLPFPGVGLDVETGARMAVEHLLGHGYGSVGMVGHPANGELNEAFYRGYAAALKAAGMPVNRTHLFEASGNDVAQGEAAAEKIAAMGRGRPRALFCTEDGTANGLLKGFHKHGLAVPEDIAVMGFGDNHSDTAIWTPLSSLVQPGLIKGRIAGEILLKHLGDPAYRDAPDTVILEPKLRIRTTCGCS